MCKPWGISQGFCGEDKLESWGNGAGHHLRGKPDWKSGPCDLSGISQRVREEGQRRERSSLSSWVGLLKRWLALNLHGRRFHHHTLSPVFSSPGRLGIDTNLSSLDFCSFRWHVSRWVPCPYFLSISVCLGLALPSLFLFIHHLYVLMMINLLFLVQPASHVHLVLSSFFSPIQKLLTCQFILSSHPWLFHAYNHVCWTSGSQPLFQPLSHNLIQFLHHQHCYYYYCHFITEDAKTQIKWFAKVYTANKELDSDISPLDPSLVLFWVHHLFLITILPLPKFLFKFVPHLFVPESLLRLILLMLLTTSQNWHVFFIPYSLAIKQS